MRRSSFTFKENHVFIEEEDNPSDKVVMVKEELDVIDIDGIRNLDLPRLLFNDEKCGNVKVVAESFLKIITELRLQKFYKPIDVNSVTNAIDEIEVSMIFLVVTFFGGSL